MEDTKLPTQLKTLDPDFLVGEPDGPDVVTNLDLPVLRSFGFYEEIFGSWWSPRLSDGSCYAVVFKGTGPAVWYRSSSTGLPMQSQDHSCKGVGLERIGYMPRVRMYELFSLPRKKHE